MPPPWGQDDGTTTISLRMEPEMWMAIHQEGAEPVREIQRRGLDRLRMDGYDEGEIEMISGDSVYAESCREQYWEARRMYDKSRKIPRQMKLKFMRPGTRKKNQKKEELGNE